MVYESGFGVREMGKPERVTPQTQMMIGSIGKGTTAMMTATVVDDGLLTWDTPVIDVLPWFALKDAQLTPRVTMRHLLCNCMGLQQRDMEFFFTGQELKAEDVIRLLRTYPLEGAFGETFGYINQAVAAGGYTAAAAAKGSSRGDLFTDYVAEMQKRVDDPIGMADTTFSFEQVQANPDHAVPHSVTAEGTYVPLPIDTERFLTSVAPAGGSWSTVSDIDRYLITQMNQGVAPDGGRVVSTENLTRTWQIGVQATPTAGYGMGWGVSHYKGIRLLSHGGGTVGFSSFLVLLPEANLGVIVLNNAGSSDAASLLPAAVCFRLLELVFGQPEEFDARLTAALETDNQAHRELIEHVQPNPDAAALAPFLGVYTNDALGKVTLALADGKFMFDASEFAIQLRRFGDATYVLWDPPLVGPRVEFSADNNGQPMFVFDPQRPDAPFPYTFTKDR